MIKKTLRLTIPNSHKKEISVELLKKILEQSNISTYFLCHPGLDPGSLKIRTRCRIKYGMTTMTMFRIKCDSTPNLFL